jgi:hypothetical protein
MKLKLYILVSLIVFGCNNSKANSCDAPSSSINLEINNVRAKLMNGGDMFWDIFGSGIPGYEIPKVAPGEKSIHASFTAALLLGGVDAGNNLYTAGQTYRQRGIDFWPGALSAMGQIDSIDCDDWNEMFNITGKEINDTKNAKGISYNMSRWPSSHAPFYDANSDGIYDPTLGDYPVIDVAHPTVVPGQLVYWVINDMGNVHTSFVGANSMGVEIQMMAYAFESSSSDAINNTTMYRYIITNKSNTTYSEFRIGTFNDFDLGDASDDYLGCDLSIASNGKKRNLFYVYNADNNDEDGASSGYGIAPPAFGITYLSPGKTSNNTILEMGSFISVQKGGLPGTTGNPANALELYHYLQGNWADGLSIKYGLDGRIGADPCKFMYPGLSDPQGRANWVETGFPGDKQAISAVSSCTLAPGERIITDFAYVWARDTAGNNLSSLEKLKLTTDSVQTAYQNLFSNFSAAVIKTKVNQLKIYPNPSTDKLYIEGIDPIRKITIYNAQGKIVKVIEWPTNHNISIEDLPQGTYFIKADEYISKFIKL